MAKTTKALLTISIASLVVGLAFVTGIVNVQNTVALYVVLPLGAVFFGLFLVFRIFENEALLYDQEQQAHPALRVKAASEKSCGCGCSAPMREKSPVAH